MAENGNSSLISVQNLCRTFQVGDMAVHALDHVTLDISQGDFVAVMGPSGSGKSTLMNILGCLDTPTSGSYRLMDQEVSDMEDGLLSNIRNRYIGFVFQSFHLLPRLTALENVLLPMRYRKQDEDVRIDRDRVREIMERLGIADRMQHHPNQLSGGQRQRVAIARALVTRPSLLLADEPTGNLDSKTSEGIMTLFDELNADNQTILIVTHEDEVARHAKRVVLMRDGKIEQQVLQQDRPSQWT
ncbi:MAG: ABC transporter ATP-binding protein [Gammaproteobacteria bacterium]|nr:ABC transporter ATP-binding protein [Gammaproteobacteria bacterium]MYD79371.1 ABC transporter ATP-binding protein [Gammaproteobacteria bacterium]